MGKRIDTDEFIRRSRLVHGNKYDYSKTHYVRAKDKVCIICPIHGEFWQLPFAHFWKGGGCKKCAMDALTTNKPKTKEQFVSDARNIHGDKYDYSKVEYKGCFDKVCIICPKHGEFWQTPDCHLHSGGCPKCKGDKISSLKKKKLGDFISKANEVHNNKYDYSKVEYKTTHTKVQIICPEHGDFEQTPYVHLSGCGCPKCNSSKLENELDKCLNEENIEHIDRKGHSWLLNENTNHLLTLDFFIPKYHIAIECQGEQHYEVIEHFGGEEKLKKTKKYDKLKKELCRKNGVTLIYYLDKKYNKYLEEDDIYFNDVNGLIDYIKNGETQTVCK